MTPTAPDRHDDGFQDDLAALATGTLTGRRRVEMLDHLESCPACAAELDELSGTVDVLMSLAPEAEPPAGFAERTVALMRADKRQMGEQPAEGSAGDTAGHSVIVPLATHRQRRGRPVHRALAVAAVVVALALGVGIGALVAGSGGPGTGSPGTATGTPGVRTATLQSASGGGGSVVLTPGRPGWLVMTVEDAGAWGTVTCQVTLADGSHRVVGQYPAGYGSWAARLPAPASSVRSVELVGQGGSTLATARFTGATNA